MPGPVSIDQARAAKARLLEQLEGLPFLAGVGIGIGRAGCWVKVNLNAPPPADVSIPGDIDGVPVQVEVVGRILPR